jgi:Phosphatidylinositol 3- and 4-kinase
MSQSVQRPRVSPQGRAFINQHVLKRTARQLPPAPDLKAVFEATLAQLKPTLDAADAVLAAPMMRPEVARVAPAYQTATQALATDVQAKVYDAAATSLQTKYTTAQAVLVAKGKADAADLVKKQVATQIGKYQEMVEAMGEVKRTYLREGGADRIRGQKLDKDKDFDIFVTALENLEAGKKKVDPKQPVAAKDATAINDLCNQLIVAGQAYLAAYAALSESKQEAKENLSRKRIVEENITAARQYGMAMQLDAAGRPSQAKPWDAETQVRMSSLRAGFSYEQGLQKAKGLKDDGSAGQSDSYWIKSADLDSGRMDDGKLTFDTKKRGDFIFKPFEGEQPATGGSDRPGAGAAKEALACSNAKMFGAQTGIDLGVPETSVAAITQQAIPNGDASKPPLVGSVQQHAGAATQIKNLPRDTFKNIKASEVRKIALMDIMSLSVDRHGGNIMVDTNDPNDPKLIPIDHGASLPSRKDFPALKQRMAGLDVKRFSESGSPVNTLLQIPSAFEPFDPDTLAKLELLDPAAIEADMKAQRDALDAVHPDLDATGKVGDDSFSMSKRSMMFLKKAAKTLSPAEIQLALGTRGEELFDAPDNQFDTVADQVIADMAPKKAAYQEVLGLSAKQQYDMHEWLKNNGWVQAVESGTSSASTFIMSDPVAALAIYKSKTPNPNPVLSPFDIGPSSAQSPTQATIDAINGAFPDGKLTIDSPNIRGLREDGDAWSVFLRLGGKAAFDQAVRAIGGTPPKRCAGGVAVMKAWTELNTPAYAQELLALKPDPTKPCLDILKDLMGGKATKIKIAQQATNARAVAGAVDPAQAATMAAQSLLAEIRQSLTEFEDASVTPPFAARCQALDARLLQGPGPNDQAEVFAKAIEADAQALSRDVYEAGLTDVREAARLFGPPLQTVRPPQGDQQAETLYRATVKQVSDIEEATGPEGTLWFSRNELQALKAASQQVMATGIPVTAAPTQQPTANGGNAPTPTTPTARVADFAWDQNSASTAKKAAVAAKLFKDRDTGMTAALKTVLTARSAIDGMKTSLAAPEKVKTLQKGVDAYGKFRLFVGSKLMGLSREPSWTGYCNDALDKTDTEMTTLRTRITGIQSGTAS